MAVVARIAYTNRIRARETILYASSQQVSLPVGFLRDQSPSKPWRSIPGWNFTADNNKIDFKEAGVSRVGTVANGNYGNGADMAAAVQAAMNAGAVSNTYTVTYDVATYKTTIARAGGAAAVELSWATGANTAVSIGKDLGFDTSADDTGLTSYTSDSVAYQSRHWLRANLGSGLSAAVAIVWKHNAGTGGTFTHQAASNDSWGLPNLSQVLVGDATIRIVYFGTQTRQWHRLIIDDVQNPLGYSEVGIWFAGPYIQPSVLYSVNLRDDPEEISAIAFATHGAHLVDIRAIRHVWFLEWLEAPEADLDLLKALELATPSGVNFFFSFDAVDDPKDTLYGYRTAMPKQFVPGNYWTPSFNFAEALA